MPKNAKLNVHKEKEFGIYVLWKSLPAHAHGMKKSELVALGLTDPLIQRIIKIKSQTEFAKCFSIKDLGTLTDWNARIKKEGLSLPSLAVDYQRQHPAVAEKIILPHVAELQEKIREQAALLTSLKRENSLLKRKLKPVPSETSKKSPVSKPKTSSEISPTTKPEGETSKAFYTSLKDLFRRKG